MWPLLTMHITQLNRECLLHLFSFLDKDSRKSLARTCSQLHDVFEDPALWSLLHFRSLTELQKDNFLLGPALRSLSICWHSSRVQVCSIEDWLKSAFQRSICSRHESLVNDFLLQVCDRCPNLASVTLSGCGHVTDDCLARLLRCAPAPSSGTPIEVESKSPRWGGLDHSEFAGLRSVGSRSALGTAVSRAPGSDLGKAGGGEAGAERATEPLLFEVLPARAAACPPFLGRMRCRSDRTRDCRKFAPNC
ncbi:PREDICTED: F-box and leucine-rich protein 22-like [Mandrillus leucophaeus]|uniref:F-box and leucine-rich protein 22-like n=1 Tax=Mandrillus leucophaeus TaxID=9568 RepID=UPI0005F57D6E|nr:PREDICTED: F-box and leucine-rich protein 22-like [Mandrillus leucophaeus]